MVFDNAVAFARAGGRTVLKAARSTSPLRLLTPRNHGRGAWVYGASLGGGLVEGDAIGVDVEVGAGAMGLFGTQASTKVYRCPNEISRQHVQARVDEGGLLVVIPDPVVCFAGARYEQSTSVDLRKAASLVYLDTFTSGRSARGERWDLASYRSATRVDREGAPLLRDAVHLDPRHGALRERMGRFEAFATLVATGPDVAPIVDAMIGASAAGASRPYAPLRVAASALRGGGAIARVAGTSVEAVASAVRSLLADLPRLLGDDPFARKW